MDSESMKKTLIHAMSDVFVKMVYIPDLHEDASGEPFIIDDISHMTASIGFGGEWIGFVSIQCSNELVARLTSKMLMMDGAVLKQEEMMDALGEIVNMVGGRFKTIFTGSQQNGSETFNMSIPSVTTGKSYQVFAVGSESQIELVMATGPDKLRAKLALKRSNKNGG